MTSTLADLLDLLRQAVRPEDVFGELAAPMQAALKHRYRLLAAIAHPDHNPSRLTESSEAFRTLGQWYAAAQRRVVEAAYGRPWLIDVASPQRRYTGDETPFSGELCDLYPARSSSERVLLKVARAVRNNDLLQTEARALQGLGHPLAGQPVRTHFPVLVERFLLRDEDGFLRHTNVLRHETDFISLAQIQRTFPQGIDAADAAWMFNRVLAALGLSHSLGLVHGCVTLDHILVRLSDHGGMLVDWCYSVTAGETIAAFSPAYAADVPPEVYARQLATPATDLYMAAASLVRLLGGKGSIETLPASVPRPIRDLLRACLLLSPHRRTSDAWQLMDDFGAVLHRLYGPPTFRHFVLSTPTTPS